MARWDEEGVDIPPQFAYRLLGREAAKIRDMSQPVRCRCGDIYDLGTVEVTARYVDCSMWHTPCCGILVDDRGDGKFFGLRYYTRLTKTSSP